MNAKRSGSFGDSQSVWLTDYRIVGLLKQKVRKIVDTTMGYVVADIQSVLGMRVQRPRQNTSSRWDLKACVQHWKLYHSKKVRF